MDFAIGDITITASRQGAIDFSTAYMEEGVSVLVAKPEVAKSIFKMFRPFKWTLWLLIASLVVVVGSTACIASKFSPFPSWNQQHLGRIRDEVLLRENMWLALGTGLMQGKYISTSFGNHM